MAVLAEGMEMPQGCFFCIYNEPLEPDTEMCILTRDAFDSTFRTVEHRRDNCPLVEVPPHGRLVDADAPISLIDTRGEKVEVTVAHIIEENRGTVKAVIQASEEK